MNEDATHVHYAMSLDARASCVLTTFELRPFLALGLPCEGGLWFKFPLRRRTSAGSDLALAPFEPRLCRVVICRLEKR
jgi:hypothetical protein